METLSVAYWFTVLIDGSTNDARDFLNEMNMTRAGARTHRRKTWHSPNTQKHDIV